MGNANNTFSVASPGFAGALNRIDQNVDMVTVRFNYKFGGFGPVVARYWSDPANQGPAIAGAFLLVEVIVCEGQRRLGFIFEDVVVQKTPRHCRDKQSAYQRLFSNSWYSH
jgi:hypothetical protein